MKNKPQHIPVENDRIEKKRVDFFLYQIRAPGGHISYEQFHYKQLHLQSEDNIYVTCVKRNQDTYTQQNIIFK